VNKSTAAKTKKEGPKEKVIPTDLNEEYKIQL